MSCEIAFWQELAKQNNPLAWLPLHRTDIEAVCSELEVSKAEHIFDIVFSADSNPGAYSHGEAAALGRLAAWQSLAELTGVRADGTFDDVYKAVKESDWYSFSSTSEWFHNIAWDFGIVCLRLDKRHIAVLAATDED